MFRKAEMPHYVADTTNPNAHIEYFDELTAFMKGFDLILPARSDVRKARVTIPRTGSSSEGAGVDGIWCEPPTVGEEEGDRGIDSKKKRTKRAILYLHGGGMCAGDAAYELGLSDILAIRSNASVLSVNYRLMGRHTAQDAVADCVSAYEYLLGKGYSPENIVFWGCSGGGMAALLSGIQVSLSPLLPNPRKLVVGSPGLGLELLLEDPFEYQHLPSVKRDLELNTDPSINADTGFDRVMVEEWIKNKEYLLYLLNHAKDVAATLIHFGSEEWLSSIDRIAYDHLKSQNANVHFLNITHFGHCFSFFYGTKEGNDHVNQLIEWAWE